MFDTILSLLITIAAAYLLVKLWIPATKNYIAATKDFLPELYAYIVKRPGAEINIGKVLTWIVWTILLLFALRYICIWGVGAIKTLVTGILSFI